MKRNSLNSSERERAAALNANITEIKTLHDDCLYGMRRYFDESHALLKYLELKTDCAYNEDCFYFYRMFIFRLRKLTEEMQDCIMDAQRMETRLHQFCLQYNRLLHHLESAVGRQERSDIFTDMESETEVLLCQFITLSETIEAIKTGFLRLAKEATIVEAN